MFSVFICTLISQLLYMCIYRCSDGRCIPDSQKYDGKINCADNSDEDECNSHIHCDNDDFHCNSTYHCISQ